MDRDKNRVLYLVELVILYRRTLEYCLVRLVGVILVLGVGVGVGGALMGMLLSLVLTAG